MQKQSSQKVRETLSRAQKARMANAGEWEAVDKNLKATVEQHQSDMAAFSQQQAKYQEEVTNLLGQQALFDTKYDEYKKIAEKMNEGDGKAMLSDEQDRLRARSEELSAKVKAHNESVVDIDKRKAEVLAEGESLLKDQQEIEALGAEMAPMVAKLQKMQGDVKKLAEEKKMAEAQALQEELKKLHGDYQTKDSTYKAKIAFFNVKRVEINYNMKSMEREFKHADDMAEILNVQIEEVNGQIVKIQENLTNYRDTASFITNTKEELEYLEKNIQKKSGELLTRANELNERQKALQTKTDEINSQVTNAELKMHWETDGLFKEMDALTLLEGKNKGKKI